MLRKNRKPSFSEAQLRQLKRTNEYLRRLTSDALREVRRIAVRRLTDRQYREAGQFFRTIATRMNCTLQVRQEILIAGREQQPEVISVIFRRRCVGCPEKRRLSNADDEEDASREALEPDPGYQAEIDFLLELVFEVSECQRSRGASPRTFFESISRLTSALLRQQRHLRDTAARQTPKIEVEHESGGCIHCQKPMNNEAENDDAMKVAMSDPSHHSEMR